MTYSQNLHAVRAVKPVRIPMADGIELDANLYMPEWAGAEVNPKFPTVFDYYPYRKDDLSAGGERLHVYMAQRGFVAISISGYLSTYFSP